MKVRPVGAKFFHADGQADISKANSSFPQFRKRA